jgi:hypothetical protein
MPAGYHLEYSGRSRTCRAHAGFYFVIPLALLLICGLLYEDVAEQVDISWLRSINPDFWTLEKWAEQIPAATWSTGMTYLLGNRGNHSQVA